MFKLLSGYKAAQIKETQFVKNVKFGKNVTVSPFVNLYDCEIGDGSFIGPFVEIQSGVKIGKNVRIQSHSFICSHVEIGDNVFVGHGVMFINDKYPRASNKDWVPQKTFIGDYASIGTNATIMPVRIGQWAMVGAGSTVLKDIPNGCTAAGNPSKIIKVPEDTIL